MQPMRRNFVETLRLPLRFTQKRIWGNVNEALSSLESEGVIGATTTEIFERIGQLHPQRGRFSILNKIMRGDIFLGLLDLEAQGLVRQVLIERRDANNNTFVGIRFQRVTNPSPQGK